MRHLINPEIAPAVARTQLFDTPFPNVSRLYKVGDAFRKTARMLTLSPRITNRVKTRPVNSPARSPAIRLGTGLFCSSRLEVRREATKPATTLVASRTNCPRVIDLFDHVAFTEDFHHANETDEHGNRATQQTGLDSAPDEVFFFHGIHPVRLSWSSGVRPGCPMDGTARS